MRGLAFKSRCEGVVRRVPSCVGGDAFFIVSACSGLWLLEFFFLTSENVSPFGYFSTLRGSLRQFGHNGNGTLLLSGSGTSLPDKKDDTFFETSKSLGPNLRLVQDAFSAFCKQAAERTGNLPCSSRGLQRIRPVLPSLITGSRIEPCGRGNVLSHLDVGTIVQHGAPHLYHMLNNAGKSVPICTYPAHMDKWVSKVFKILVYGMRVCRYFLLGP